jgi:hypothetical protein
MLSVIMLHVVVLNVVMQNVVFIIVLPSVLEPTKPHTEAENIRDAPAYFVRALMTYGKSLKATAVG